MNLGRMVRIVERKRYDTQTATLLADDEYWDGHNNERHGRNTWLLRTPKSAFFVVNRTMWQGEADTLSPVDLDEAIDLYEGALRSHHVTYADAFPGVEVEDA